MYEMHIKPGFFSLKTFQNLLENVLGHLVAADEGRLPEHLVARQAVGTLAILSWIARMVLVFRREPIGHAVEAWPDAPGRPAPVGLRQPALDAGQTWLPADLGSLEHGEKQRCCFSAFHTDDLPLLDVVIQTLKICSLAHWSFCVGVCLILKNKFKIQFFEVKRYSIFIMNIEY